MNARTFGRKSNRPNAIEYRPKMERYFSTQLRFVVPRSFASFARMYFHSSSFPAVCRARARARNSVRNRGRAHAKAWSSLVQRSNAGNSSIWHRQCTSNLQMNDERGLFTAVQQQLKFTWPPNNQRDDRTSITMNKRKAGNNSNSTEETDEEEEKCPKRNCRANG